MTAATNTLRSLVLAGITSAQVFAAEPLVDGAWVERHGDSPDVVVLDVRSKLDKGSREVYVQGHVPGSIYSDYLQDGWRATRDGVIGMLPELAELERLIGGLGIGNDDHVVIVPAGASAVDYGSATRVYWTFKVLGHDAVSVLDGGYALWAAEGRAIETGSNRREPTTFVARYRPELVASRDDVAEVVRTGKGALLIDNRPAMQYVGETKMKQAARHGAIPGARNIAQEAFYDESASTFASLERLAALWREAGIADDSEQITYCNTGHWASLGWFASSELLGNERARLYDGSIAEWSQQTGLPMVNTN